MNKIKVLIGRIYQKVLWLASNFIKFREPHIIDSFDELNNIIVDKNLRNVLIFTTKRVLDSDFYLDLKKHIEKNSMCYEQIYEIAEPTVKYIEEKVKEYQDKHIDLIVSIGGGSVLDASKLLSARLANPKQAIEKMKGVLKVKKKIIPIIAVPTTAGTGSECTVAAVVTNDITNDKYAVNDPKLIPEYAIFEPSLMFSLPSELTAITGMDALTHAVEAWIGSSNTHKTKKAALQAIQLIFNNLVVSYKEPKNETARKNMQYASYLAGVAFTRAYVGYVHSFAHAIGGVTHLRHGYLCAMGLPIILEQYGKKAEKKLAKLARKTYLVNNYENNNARQAWIFIEKIKELNKELNIASNLNGCLNVNDYPYIIKHINKETYPLYPVPCYFDDDKLREILNIYNKGE